MKTRISNAIAASILVKQKCLRDPIFLAQIETLSKACIAALNAGGKIILCGNGGSFGDAQHISAEFTARFTYDRRPLASVTLGCNASAISAIGNDYGFDQVFARELVAIGSPKDLLIAISTSGHSPNILKVLTAANEMGVPTWGLTGGRGGEMASLCECIRVPSSVTARIQECHILIGHIVCEMVQEAVAPNEGH